MFSLFCYFFVLSICGIMDEVVTSGDILQFRLSALLCQTYTGYLFVFIICYFFFSIIFRYFCFGHVSFNTFLSICALLYHI